MSRNVGIRWFDIGDEGRNFSWFICGLVIHIELLAVSICFSHDLKVKVVLCRCERCDPCMDVVVRGSMHSPQASKSMVI